MSSIYKKGRDGYYYYQTYLYDPRSKKKNKKIFHALRTKDLSEARLKQQELDLKYENQNQPNSKGIRMFVNSNSKTIFILLTIFTGILLLIADSFILYFENDKTEEFPIAKKGDLKSQEFQVINNEFLQDTTSKNVEIIESEVDEIPKSPPLTILQEKVISKVDELNFTIERVDELSGAFKQVKVNVTVNENSSSDNHFKICTDITKQFNQYSNIVICIYADNPIGKNLALGNDKSVSIQEKKKFWLAMYSYNSVEGEFFDDNPSDYLSVY